MLSLVSAWSRFNIFDFLYTGFSLSAWKTKLGLSGPSLEIHYIRQLLQDLGVATYLKDSSSKCDWTKAPYSAANANGWTDSKRMNKMENVGEKASLRRLSL